jgi:hypothetical protein
MRFSWIIFLSLCMAGCASNVVYNPMQVATQQELLLNESGFKAIQDGMTLDEVHKIMGTELVIGYKFQSPDYKPLTIPNPYRSEAGKDPSYFIEYYIEAINQPDNIVSDSELMPLIFKDGKLIGRGWPLANSVRTTVSVRHEDRPSNPSA